MKRISMVGALVLALSSMAPAAQALPIFDVSGSVSSSDPTQLGRLSRNGIPQDWFGGESFPGVINPTTTYHYHQYMVNVGNTPFIQIDFDSVSANTFVSAYLTSYAPDSAGAPNLGFDTHWLGDAGQSGNFFGTDPLFFQVIVPQNGILDVVINTTAAGNVGVGDPFHLTVEGFIDNQFDDPVPEPATMVLAGSGLALAALKRRRRT